MAMQHITNPDEWSRGKTVDRIDHTGGINCNTIYFKDGTAALIEAENLGGGTIGPVWYEIDPSRPVHEQ